MRPSDVTRIEAADVYKGNQIAGRITRRDGGTTFEYRDDYLHGGGGPVASTLPLRGAPFRREGGAVPPFFAGLLPEGARLQAVINAVRTSADDELSLLLAVGADAVGNVTVVPEGADPRDPGGADLPSNPADIDFDVLLADAMGATSGDLDRAIPGVQDKVSDAMISFPVKGRLRPAILKLDPPAYPLLTANEHFFLETARTAGFAVPRHELVHDVKGRAGLLIERFDRQREQGATVRVAQEDGCQILNRYPADKYRVSVNDVATRVVDLATSPQAAILDLLLQVAFSWAIGNGDLHAKNYSLQWRLDGLVTATPVYDVISTLPYPLDHRMALDLDGRDTNFRADYFARFGERFGLPTSLIGRRLGELADRLSTAIDGVSDVGYDTRTAEQMVAEITRRTRGLYPKGS
jgi:serine/threonine-protein kinase HipA